MSPILICGYFFVLGTFLGIIYDVFKIYRLIFASKNFLIFLLDVFYFLICSICVFVLSLVVNMGCIRYFIIQSAVIGFVSYKLTIGKLFNFIFIKILKFFNHLISKWLN